MITAETTTTVGTPATLSYTFLTAFWVGSSVSVEGVVSGRIAGTLCLNGSVLRIGAGLVRLSGNILSVPASYLRLDGSVGTAFDLLRSGEVVILDGWVTLYVVEALLFAAIGPADPIAESVDLAIEAFDPRATMPGLEATLGVYANQGMPGLEASIGPFIQVSEPVEMAIGPAEPVTQSVDLSIDVDGYKASGVVVLDSPSAEWAADEAAEDA